jgi:hypothetical protein
MTGADEILDDKTCRGRLAARLIEPNGALKAETLRNGDLGHNMTGELDIF